MMWRPPWICVLFIGTAILALPAEPHFEIVSVKLNKIDGPTDFVPQRSGSFVRMHNVQLGNLILYAYRAQFYEVANPEKLRLPDGWNWYDIEARADSSATDDEIRQMFRSLLAEEFGMKLHRQTQTANGFVMSVSDRPSKLQRSTSPQGRCGIESKVEGNYLSCKAAPISDLASMLSSYLKAPVSDQTHLEGLYDLGFLFARENQPDSPLPSIFTGLNEELGLNLKSGKANVEMLVIDQLQKPSAN